MTTSTPAAGRPVALTAAQQELRLLLAHLDRPASIAELSERTARHPNSVRELLAALVAGGYVRRHRLSTGQRGRRAWGYSIAGPASAEEATHSLATLSDALTSVLEGEADAVHRAYSVGHAWGARFRAERPARHGDAVETACDGLARLGYAPEVVAPDRVELLACPLRVDGQNPRPLVCELHRGLIDALLERDDTALTPGIRPGVCAVGIGARPDAASDGSPA